MRGFTGNDYVQTALGACGIGFGPATMASICYPAGSGTRVLWYVGNATSGANRIQIAITSGKWQLRLGGSAVLSPTITGSSEPQLVAISKAAGTVAPRYHQYLYDGGAWTHEDGGSTLANAGTPVNQTRIGNWANAINAWDGAIHMIGLWDIVLSDAQVESLPFNLSAWFAPKQPLGLWILDQSEVAQAVADMSGNGADQNLINGTTINANSVPLWTPGTPIGMAV